LSKVRLTPENFFFDIDKKFTMQHHKTPLLCLPERTAPLSTPL